MFSDCHYLIVIFYLLPARCTSCIQTGIASVVPADFTCPASVLHTLLCDPAHQAILNARIGQAKQNHYRRMVCDSLWISVRIPDWKQTDCGFVPRKTNFRQSGTNSLRIYE